MEDGILVISQIICSNFSLYIKRTNGLQAYMYSVNLSTNLNEYESQPKYASNQFNLLDNPQYFRMNINDQLKLEIFSQGSLKSDNTRRRISTTRLNTSMENKVEEYSFKMEGEEMYSIKLKYIFFKNPLTEKINTLNEFFADNIRTDFLEVLKQNNKTDLYPIIFYNLIYQNKDSTFLKNLIDTEISETNNLKDLFFSDSVALQFISIAFSFKLKDYLNKYVYPIVDKYSDEFKDFSETEIYENKLVQVSKEIIESGLFNLEKLDSSILGILVFICKKISEKFGNKLSSENFTLQLFSIKFLFNTLSTNIDNDIIINKSKSLPGNFIFSKEKNNFFLDLNNFSTIPIVTTTNNSSSGSSSGGSSTLNLSDIPSSGRKKSITSNLFSPRKLDQPPVKKFATDWKFSLEKLVFSMINNRSRNSLQNLKWREFDKLFKKIVKKVDFLNRFSKIDYHGLGPIQDVDWDFLFSKFYSSLASINPKSLLKDSQGFSKYNDLLKVSLVPDELKHFLPFIQLSKIFKKNFVLKYSSQILSYLEVEEWKHLEVGIWIFSLRVDEIFKVIKNFLKHDIVGSYLFDLTRSDLSEMGLNIGNQIRVLNSIQNLIKF